MVRLARKYPGYNLEIHKGYPTRAHRDAIKAQGISEIHRVTYCKNFVGSAVAPADIPSLP
jgi:ribonuclease HII